VADGTFYIDPDAAGDEARFHIEGECVFCEDTTADFTVEPRGDKALRVRCERCGAVTEVER
jgi:hypothetical protein